MALETLLNQAGIILQDHSPQKLATAAARKELTLLMGENFTLYDKVRLALVHERGVIAERGGVVDKILALLVDFGLVRYNRQAGTFRFASKKAKSYVDGMWLEEYSYWAVLDLGVDPQDVRFSQKIWTRTGHNRLRENEIDVLFACGGQVHLISNKCARSLISRRTNAGKNFDSRIRKAMSELTRHRSHFPDPTQVHCAVVVSSDLVDELDGGRLRHKMVSESAAAKHIGLIGLDDLAWTDFKAALQRCFPALAG